jgi:hypothetical protein
MKLIVYLYATFLIQPLACIQKMKIKLLLVLLIFLSVLLSFTSPEYCTFRDHFKIDKALLIQKEIVSKNDTIILYRHWAYTNGENGYGKAILKKDSLYSIKDFTLDSNRSLNSSVWQMKEGLKEVYELLNKCLVEPDTNYIEPSTRMSHDGEHVIEVYAGYKLIYNFCIRDLWLYPNRFNNNVKLISLLRDKEMAEPFGIKIISHLSTEGREKPIHNPKVNSDTTIEYQKFYYIQKRFLRPKVVYEWTNNEWIISD